MSRYTVGLSIYVVAALTATGCRGSEVSPRSPQVTESVKPGTFSPDIMIASYSNEESKALLLKAASKIGASIVYDYVNFNMVAIRKPANMTLQDAIATLKKVDGVLDVVEDQMCEIDDSYSTTEP